MSAMRKAAQIPPQPWMTAPETAAVLDALTARGTPARFVGGCVRDAVAGRAVRDVDIATPEAPDEVTKLLADAGIKAIPTGIDHGTVTAVVDGVHFEVTTLRRDVETYGRRAKVAFTDAWDDDAARRDFTMNAIYADGDGTIYDPTGGLADLKAGRVRFVGDAETRIREDVLRLLRYFRFHADYGAPPPDEAALAACRKLAPELPTLSAERVWSEIRRLFMSPRAGETLELMRAEDVLAYVLPEADNISRFEALIAIEAALELAPDPVRRLAALIDGDSRELRELSRRLRHANQERDRLIAIAEARGAVKPNLDARDRRRLLYRLGATLYGDLVLLGWAEMGARGKPDSAAWKDLLAASEGWTRPDFPLGGGDVMDAGIPKGPRVGDVLRAVEEWWAENDFTPGREECMERLRSLAKSSGGGGRTQPARTR